MRSEARIFQGVALFLFVLTVVYAFWTNKTQHAAEPVGVAALLLSGGLCGIIGTFFAFVTRRIDARPEDRPDAEIAEGAGELGFFSPGSYWPLGIGVSAALAGAGLAFVQLWLAITGVVLVLGSVAGLLFEYYVGQHSPRPPRPF
jgi:cytochrome c oxidase subunit IV